MFFFHGTAPEFLNKGSGVVFYSVILYMKNPVNIIKAMLRDIEKMDSELFVYASIEDAWIQVSVSSFEFYMHDEAFKKTCNKWRAVIKKMGLKVVFVCGWIPKEEKLLELANKNNLIITK